MTVATAQLSLRPLAKADHALVRSWFDDDADEFLGREWIDIVTRSLSHNVYDRCLVLAEDGTAVGAIWLRMGAGQTAWFERIIAPEARSFGYGKSLLVLAARHPACEDIVRFSGDVCEHNGRCRKKPHRARLQRRRRRARTR